MMLLNCDVRSMFSEPCVTFYDFFERIYDKKSRGKHIVLTGAERKSSSRQSRHLIAVINIFIASDFFHFSTLLKPFLKGN